MPDEFRVVVVSDIHYASAGEKARGGYEYQALRSWTQRVAVGLFRRWIWLKDPLAHNHQLERFLAAAGPADLAVANGDYSCDSAFVGLSDDAAFASARHVLERLRERFPGRLVAGFGDHELGKKSLFGGAGGLRLRSRERSIQELGLEDFWRRELGPWVLFGVTSSLVALPVFRPETQPEEQPEWERLRELHLKEVRDAFRSLRPGQRVVLFCHDPTALPFLWGEPEVRARRPQLALTVIGHLHTPLILRWSRWLVGMPVIPWLGNGVRRMSRALNAARCWREFGMTLCPSLSGCEWLKDGGFGSLRLEAGGSRWQWQVHPLPWGSSVVA